MMFQEPYIPEIPDWSAMQPDGLNSITVDKQKLLEALKENRKNHRKTFEEALKGYKEAVIEELEDRLQKAKKGKKVDVRVALPIPENHTKDYDLVIGMLEMSLDNKITITNDEFRRYVQDEWGWMQAFIATSSNYTSVPGAAR